MICKTMEKQNRFFIVCPQSIVWLYRSSLFVLNQEINLIFNKIIKVYHVAMCLLDFVKRDAPSYKPRRLLPALLLFSPK